MKCKLKPFIFPLVLLLLVVVLTAFKLHGSSIGMYNFYFYGEGYRDPNLLYGKPRNIRSDEWLVLTPWIVSESQIHYASENTLYLARQNLTMTGVPVANWTIAFKPQNWGFLVIPVEYAFSLMWWIRTFLLIVAAYLLMMELTNQNILGSVIGALAFWLTPYFQWWYATPALEVVFFGTFTFLFFLRTLRSCNRLSLAINTLFFIYFSICFALIFYPPFQIPTALFLGLVGIGIVINYRSKLTPTRIRSLVVTAVVAMLVIGMVLVAYYLLAKDTITIMQNTVYPGSRRVAGGDMSPLLLLTGFFNVQLLNDRKVPEFLFNQSEAAGFFMFSLILLPVFLFQLIKSALLKKRVDLILLFAVVFELLALSWAIFGLPRILGKVLFLEYVPSRRMLLALGFVNFFLIVYYLYQFNFELTLDFKIIAGLLSLGFFLTILWIGLYLRAGRPIFIQNSLKIFLIAAASGVLMALLLFRQRIAFLILFLAFTIVTSLRVNPLYRGLDTLLSSPLSIALKQGGDHDQKNSAWVVYDNLILAQYLAANGVRVINGTYYSPNLEFWRKFDPDGSYADIYNRYSHVLFRSVNGDTVSFTLVQGDVFSVNINPCNTIIRDLDVRYYVFTQQVSYACLTFIDSVDFPNMPVYIYKRLD
ncbi:hypothetical protein [Anaerolinea sp.]|uniref:DUF7657 domain-containing protein n=1 Tax=Anaerolinea sp. TaxID=1872519 RepID=UPI002ACEBC8C|nr:hypothetical protein [Anaerolinea sp.]